jgi:Predicted membrane protein
MLHFIWTIIIGFLAGAVAKLLMPGKDPGGFIITTLLGIAGAVLARYLGMALGLYHDEDSAGFIASVVGAIILLAIYRLFTKRRARTP